METTVKCPICGEPYKVYPFYAGDQSACPKCLSKVMGNEYKKDLINRGNGEGLI